MYHHYLSRMRTKLYDYSESKIDEVLNKNKKSKKEKQKLYNFFNQKGENQK